MMRRMSILGIVSLVCLASFSGHALAQQAQQDKIYTVPKTTDKKGPPQQQQAPPAQLPKTSMPTSPPKMPQAVPPRSGQGSEPRQSSEPRNVAERVLRQKLGSEGFQNLLGQIESMKTEAATGRGASMADRWYDGARPRTGNDEGLRPSGTQFFQRGGSQSQVSEPMPVTSGAYKHVTVQEAKGNVDRYGSQGGGIVLEGVATGLGEIDNVRYDSRFNAFILNNRAVYFVKIPPKTVAVLCRAFAKDDQERVGVSLGQTVELVYGEVPKVSELAWDLKIADHFLGDIAFARNDWTAGYRFANGFKPEPNQEKNWNGAVYFIFNGFQFQTAQEEARLTQANLDVRLVPLSDVVARDGGFMPDYEAISQGRVPQQFERNARHVAENIAYYRRERIIDRMFAYGEVAAFIRALKRAGFDLEALADNIPGGR